MLESLNTYVPQGPGNRAVSCTLRESGDNEKESPRARTVTHFTVHLALAFGKGTVQDLVANKARKAWPEQPTESQGRPSIHAEYKHRSH